MAWCCADNCPCTGVSVGCSFVNSSSKLLVSALPFCNTPHHVSAYNSKAGQIPGVTHDCREVWWGYTFVEYIIPDDVLEERLSLDLLSVSFPRAKAAVRVSSKKLQVINVQQSAESGAAEANLLKDRNSISGHRDRV